ncbi:MAG: triphosphoribosyl-dephospho-CoA synthase [Solirubrobacterales bacterium]|nr:triphosphoribosyl-dephospho-CoA synthase [Solirubrobacterales bacterium]
MGVTLYQPHGEPRELQQLVELACLLEVSAPKPGNINPAHDFGDTTYVDMLRSALALGQTLTTQRARSRRVGQLIADGMSATARAVATNTNLGIVLLFAPLARAATTAREGEDLAAATERTLSELDVADASLAFDAIASAQPGGLSEAPEHDVRAPATVTLREAMAAAAHRDSIASEYASGYRIVFGTGLALLVDALAEGAATLDAVVALHLGLLARYPDTLIQRKAGVEAAEAVRAGARQVIAGQRDVEEFDSSLRAGGNHQLNPGTTADLVATTLLVALLTGVELS